MIETAVLRLRIGAVRYVPRLTGGGKVGAPVVWSDGEAKAPAYIDGHIQAITAQIIRHFVGRRLYRSLSMAVRSTVRSVLHTGVAVPAGAAAQQFELVLGLCDQARLIP